VTTLKLCSDRNYKNNNNEETFKKISEIFFSSSFAQKITRIKYRNEIKTKSIHEDIISSLWLKFQTFTMHSFAATSFFVVLSYNTERVVIFEEIKTNCLFQY
jgi:hypothetical protein